jgi:hypothetical protein
MLFHLSRPGWSARIERGHLRLFWGSTEDVINDVMAREDAEKRSIMLVLRSMTVRIVLVLRHG